MITIHKVLLVLLVLSVAACGDDGQPDQADQSQMAGQPNPAGQPPTAGRPDPVADQKAGIYSPTTVDTKAEIVYYPPVPTDVVDLDFDGVVVIQLVVGTNGNVDTAFVERSSNRVSVDSLMLDVAKKLVWTPAVHDGDRVKMRTSFPFMFRTHTPTPGEETETEE